MKSLSIALLFTVLNWSQGLIAQEADSNNNYPEADITFLFPESPAKSYVAVLCSACHDLTRLVVQQKDYASWDNTLVRMIGGMVGDEQYDLIVDYLTDHFGPNNPITEFPLNINSLSKSVLLRLPGIDKNNADAILNYIEINGNISSLDEIRQLVGSDDDWNALSGLVVAK